MAKAKEAFVPHKNVPRPPTLEVERADNSGTVNTDVQFMADRQAIINHVMAYSYLIDEGRWDDWFALFSEDIAFATTVPELGTIEINGKKAFWEMANLRYIIPGKNSKGVRRHTQGNVHVAEQTATTAKVRAYMFISSVPAADHLHMLTTGTYNADLEKRDGKWTITRWYIECDAPLSPSTLPEGFTEDEFKWIPDPTFEIPGAGPVATAVKGQVTLKNHPFSMGDLYKKAPQWTWTDTDMVIFDYLTPAAAAAALLPEQLTTFPIPELPGYSGVKAVWARYGDSSVGTYNEFVIFIPALFNGELCLHVPFIYVDTDAAMAGGREVGGWPKKIGEIGIERSGDECRCSFDRHGKRLASAKVNVGGKLFSTPLPADKPVSLPYPYNMTFPLPAPTGKEQETVPLPTTSLKVIPSVDSETPVVARLIGAPWRLRGTFQKGSDASLAYRQSEDDPFYQLPILKTLGGMYFEGDMTLTLNELRVLDDMLKK
jgi:acetoacetate decarboxylase